jgi:hypothetical protein
MTEGVGVTAEDLGEMLSELEFGLVTGAAPNPAESREFPGLLLDSGGKRW